MPDPYFPVVERVSPGPGRTVYAYFTDGSIRRYDMQPHIDRGGVFAPLADEGFFRERLTVLNDTVAWDLSGHYDPANCLDIDPFTVYEAPAVADPLEDVG
ncbi:MAG: DUF2442 domain-containing protein [Clostridiales bacterium]|nr:DUF2442 domain-containing protein [Clostridiales bacterium]